MEAGEIHNNKGNILARLRWDRCDECHYFMPFDEAPEIGRCVRYPPVMAKTPEHYIIERDNTNWQQPIVSKSDVSCGEFKENQRDGT